MRDSLQEFHFGPWTILITHRQLGGKFQRSLSSGNGRYRADYPTEFKNLRRYADSSNVNTPGTDESMEFAEEIREFLIECNENLDALDQQVVELEKNPTDEQLIASVFRTIHTIKGTSGFFGFNILGSITHIAESILGQVREKERHLTPELVSLILETVDAVKQVLLVIETTNEEGEDRYEPLRNRLDAAFSDCNEEAVLTLEPAQILFTQSAKTSGATSLEDSPPDSESRRDSGPYAFAAPETEFVREERHSADGVTAESAGIGLQRAVLGAVVKYSEPATDSRQSVDVTALSPQEIDRKARGSRGDDGVAHSTIRVDISLLDKLMNLVGELVLARNQILQGATQSASSNAPAQRLNQITTELQEGVMRTRMQPIGMVWNMLPRVVRDLAAEMGKKIEIQMEGATTELDKTIIESIKDPITHIVRNACDHGIECPEVRVAKGKSPHGTIHLRAFHEGGHVNIEIVDDGAGIDPEKIKNKAVERGLIRAEQAAQMTEWEALRLIFLPGFSTAQKITSISGRGVGMDVVKTNIEKISGTVDLINSVGRGSTLKIKIPLTLAIIPGLIVSMHTGTTPSSSEIRSQRFVIPQANLLELVRLEGEKGIRQIEHVHGAEIFRRRGKLLPLAYLSDLLGLSGTRTNVVLGKSSLDKDKVINIVVVQAEETAFGLVVDDVHDTQEIVVKALGRQLKSLTCYLGATIMGDGKIALILDVVGLARMASIMTHKLEGAKAEIRPADTGTDDHQLLLLFRAGNFPRLVIPLSGVARLEEVPTSRVEYAGGAPVLHYREAIMPLLSLSALLDPRSFNRSAPAENLQVIIVREGEQHAAVVVDEILGIIDEAVTIRRTCHTYGLLGSAVVGGKVTDIVDHAALLNGTPENYLSNHQPPNQRQRSEGYETVTHSYIAPQKRSSASGEITIGSWQ